MRPDAKYSVVLNLNLFPFLACKINNYSKVELAETVIHFLHSPL